MSFQIKKFSSIVASMINWIAGVTDKITDFNVGSVTRSLLEAFAMELEELYYQLLQATEEAIEEAIYRSFNFPKNSAQRATGSVRFTRLVGSEILITISEGTLVGTNTDPSIVFETQSEAIVPYLTGTATGGGVTSLVDSTVDFVVLGAIAGSRVVNVTDNGETPLAGVTSITSTVGPNDTLNFGALTAGSFGPGDLYKVIIPYIDVSVQAVVPGIGGNIAAHSITILKTNVPNIESIDNLIVFSDGLEEETDLHRKARFALYIQSLARATRGALEYSAQTVEQVVAAKAIDDVRPLVYSEVYGAPSTWTDITNAMRNPGDAYVKLFADAEAVNDALYIGAKELFEYMNMHLGQIGVIAANDLFWEYWNGARWANLKADQVTNGGFNYTCLISHTSGTFATDLGAGKWVLGGTLGSAWVTGTGYHCDGSFVDGTDAGTGPFTQSGTLSFTPPSDWVANSIALAIPYYRLWIRLRKVTGGATYTTTPTGDWCSLPPGLGYVNLYCHDGSGTLSDTLKASVENVVELYRGCGIVVEVKEPTKTIKDIACTITIAANYDSTELGVKVTQAIKDFVNSKVLGEDLYLAELYQLIMGVNDKAILNCEITDPSADIIIPNSGIVRYGTVVVTVVQEE